MVATPVVTDKQVNTTYTLKTNHTPFVSYMIETASNIRYIQVGYQMRIVVVSLNEEQTARLPALILI